LPIRFFVKNNEINQMTLSDFLTMFGGTQAAAATFGFLFGIIIFWIPRNIK
jgi:hypothetical protein